MISCALLIGERSSVFAPISPVTELVVHANTFSTERSGSFCGSFVRSAAIKMRRGQAQALAGGLKPHPFRSDGIGEPNHIRLSKERTAGPCWLVLCGAGKTAEAFLCFNTELSVFPKDSDCCAYELEHFMLKSRRLNKIITGDNDVHI